MTYFDPILSHFEDFEGKISRNGSKWTHTKQMKTQIRRRGGMAPPGAWGKWLQMGSKKKSRRRGGKWLQMDAHKTDENTNLPTPGEWLRQAPRVNGSKRAIKKKTEPPAREKTGVPSKVKTIWRGSTFFFRIRSVPGGSLTRSGGVPYA